MAEEHATLLLRPPEPKTLADFVVIMFVLVIATTIMLAVIGTGIIILFRPEQDVSSLVSILTDLINTIIGALIGFIAGKNQGKVQAMEASAS